MSTTNLAELMIVDIAGHLAYRQWLALNDGQSHHIKPELAVGIYRLFITTEIGRYSQKLSIGY